MHECDVAPEFSQAQRKHAPFAADVCEVYKTSEGHLRRYRWIAHEVVWDQGQGVQIKAMNG